MTTTRTSTSQLLEADTELAQLKEMLADDCKCRARHDHRCPSCSGSVTHRFISCVDDYNVCKKAATLGYALMSTKRLHKNCMNPVADCWKIIPI
jgi:hypothetical protein